MILLLSGLALAERPTAGGLFAYDAADVIQTWDTGDGRIRVWFSVEGPSATILDDADVDGVPDYVQLVGREVGAAWDHFGEVGFRPPVSEGEVGLGPIGGSAAFDVYLLDFGGSADGAFRVDGCAGRVCAGHLTIENDFAGYGYRSLDEAVDTLASHELFHAIQAAYHPEWPVWASEGTAVWAQRSFEPDNEDFIRFARAYLQDAGRPLDRPPAGPVPTFAYATALWFDFVETRHPGAVVELAEIVADQQQAGAADVVAGLDRLLSLRGDNWPETFSTFTAWNLATGLRAGEFEGYTYAARLSPGVALESTEGVWVGSPRVFPLAAVFARVDHPGGPFEARGRCDASVPLDPVVMPAIGSDWGPAGRPLSVRELADAPAGSYYVGLIQREPGGESYKELICVGAEDPACELDCAGPTDTDGDLGGGCGCAAGGSGAWVAFPLALLWRRRRK